MGIEIENNSNRVSTTTLTFMYGTLKRGFSNHGPIPSQPSKRHQVSPGHWRVIRCVKVGVARLDELEGTSGITMRGC
ncbi:hypothetical protein NC652_010431 [Populus alba x Populus x berolinensis]|nr:hypothetical protein NC652_010431 [Populus alba x Populus x berolinensis]